MKPISRMADGLITKAITHGLPGLAQQEQLGLAGMRERAEADGGLIVEGSPFPFSRLQGFVW